MKTRPIFAILSSFALALLLVYVNAPQGIFVMGILCSAATISCSLYSLCYCHLKEVYNRRLNEQGLVESLSLFLHYNSRGNTFGRTLSQIIENSTISELKLGFERVKKQVNLGRSLWQALDSFLSEHFFRPNINFADEVAFIVSLRKFLMMYAKGKSLRSSVALDSLQRNSTINLFLSTLLPSFLLFIFVGTAVLSPSSTGLLFISLMMLIVVPSIYAISSTMFSRRLIAETV